MEQSDEIVQTIYVCMEELNHQLPADGRLLLSPKTILVGDGGALDSLGLITLLVNIEQVLLEKQGLTVALLDTLMAEHAGTHPLHTVSTLAAWAKQQQVAVQKAG